MEQQTQRNPHEQNHSMLVKVEAIHRVKGMSFRKTSYDSNGHHMEPGRLLMSAAEGREIETDPVAHT